MDSEDADSARRRGGSAAVDPKDQGSWRELGEGAAGRVAVLSIHPQYADGILEGTKTVEFRRWRLAADVRTVVIYATKPVGRVVGSFNVGGVHEGTPGELWRECAANGGIGRAAYENYFRGTARAFAIIVEGVRRLGEPLALTDLHPDLVPPQSVRYLEGLEHPDLLEA